MIIFLLWLFQALYFLSIFVYWIQTKEYRIDKLIDFAKSGQAARKLFLPVIFAKIGLLSCFLFIQNIPLLYICLFGVVDLFVLYRVWRYGVTRPKLTLRAILIIISSLLSLSAILFLGKSYLTAEIILVTSPILFMILTDIPVLLVKNKIIENAKRRLIAVKPTVIAITGSYGKTTTKEFIFQLLSTSHNTVATEGSQNTPIGIARKILKDINPGVKYFVVEMGAYKLGEINKLCEIVKPDISVLTGIDTQHVSLFGSFENLKKAKYEIIENLGKNGLAIFNTNNDEVVTLAKKARDSGINVAEYKSGKVVGKNVISIAKIVKTATGMNITVNLGRESELINIPFYGNHFAENLSCAIYIARLVNVPWVKIKKACRNLTLPRKTMNFIPTGKGVGIIDDSFNSTPTAFASGLTYLSSLKGKKVVITPGLLELGKFTESEHVKIGNLLKNKFDKIILVNREFAPYIKKGLGSSKKPILIVNENAKDVIKLAQELYNSGYSILLEGRVPVNPESIIRKGKS